MARTVTVTVSLGHSALTGKSAIDQAIKFKSQLRALQKKPESVTLLTMVSVEPPHMGVSAVYDADDPCAVAWVKRAEEVSGELWQKMAERRRAR